MFGDLPQGNGDPSLVLFPRVGTPNQHALAEEFVLLDNFYCSGVLSADGHAWATEAYVTDYLERHFGGFIRSYPYDGDDPLAYAASGFLWDNALAHGKTFRILPNDHTSGTKPGLPSPRASVADNDLALGRIVEAITRSKFWPETAIFVVEDDPQAGLDHVDGHRTFAQVISPYTRRRSVDHSFYSQVGMIKTIELILGLPPMNQMDLAAPAMRNCFAEQLDVRAFAARPNEIPLDEMNPPLSALSGERLEWARKSLELDLDEVDEADEDTLNRIVWHATRGYDVAYPKVGREED